MIRKDDSIDVEGLVNELEIKLDRLKILYEQYFMGIAKREPLVPLKDVVRIMRSLEQVQIRNTGVRYKLRTLVQRFNVYRTYWNRTLRAINNGTYHRDVARVSRKLSEKGVTLPSKGRVRSVAEMEKALTEAYSKSAAQAGATDGGEPAGAGDGDNASRPAAGKSASSVRGGIPATARPANEAGAPGAQAVEAAATESTPTALHPRIEPPTALHPRIAPRAAAATPAAASKADHPDDIPEREIQSIYRRFIKAKELCGEDTSAVRYESLAKSIRQQLPKIRQQNPNKEVEFQVVLRNGRAIIRAKTS